MSGDKCLETSVWRKVSGDKCLETNVWRQVSGDEVLDSIVLIQVSRDKCLDTSVWRQVSGDKCLETSAWRQLCWDRWRVWSQTVVKRVKPVIKIVSMFTIVYYSVHVCFKTASPRENHPSMMQNSNHAKFPTHDHHECALCTSWEFWVSWVWNFLRQPVTPYQNHQMCNTWKISSSFNVYLCIYLWSVVHEIQRVVTSTLLSAYLSSDCKPI